MGKYIPFCLSKLFSALHRKDWVEVENQQKKMGFESFMRRRGVELSKGTTRLVAIVRRTIQCCFLDVFVLDPAQFSTFLLGTVSEESVSGILHFFDVEITVEVEGVCFSSVLGGETLKILFHFYVDNPELSDVVICNYNIVQMEVCSFQ